MDKVTRTQAIKRFLERMTHPDLAALYSLDMECQVNVAQDGGTKIDSEFKGRQWHAWTDGVQSWKSFRIPINAATEPTFEDSTMSFDLTQHAEGIGMTGWDWKNRLSRWVAFDFDAISGHKENHERKMNEADLTAVKQAASDLPWVTVRKSTGGKGLHLYVMLTTVETANHTEHAALARAILGKMSAAAGYDFSTKVDVCGGNMWVWHRKMGPQPTHGLSLIKQGEILEDIPPNWRDHVKVIRGSRKKNLPSFINVSDSTTPSEEEQFFLELTGQTIRVPLDDEHKRVIQWLESNRTHSWWDSDHHMLVTHSFHLAQCHEELRLRGIFQTIAKGTEAGTDQNLFAFPVRGGGWACRRYTIGVAEAETWEQDGRGWTRCFFNREADLRTAARSKNGVEDPAGGFQFTEAENAKKAAEMLGAQFEIPTLLRSRKAKIKEHKDGRLVVHIASDSGDVFPNGSMSGWMHKKQEWIRIFNVKLQNPAEVETANYDDLVRHLITESQEDYGWVLKGNGTEWRNEPLVHVRTGMKSMNIASKEIEQILGVSVMKAWTLVNRPFQPEYVGDRMWNRDAAQFRFQPSPNKEGLRYPTWMKILKHCGEGLDDAVSKNGWCKINGILTGADYLKVWIASLFKEPMQPLPYLFFYSKEQDTGKSIFHEALELLVTAGYQRADQALISSQGFNGELKNAVICVVEETDLRKHKDAHNRIKDWVTSLKIPIHEKGETPYHAPNSTHWIQTSNSVEACPIFPGDTRITMIYVAPLDPMEKIPKKRLIPELEKEAPDFMAEILGLEIPPSNSRLNVEIVSTLDKMQTEEMNKNLLEQFVTEKFMPQAGEWIKFSDFYDLFKGFIDPNDEQYWSKKRVSSEVGGFRQYPRGRSPFDGQLYIGNIILKSSMADGEERPRKPKYVIREKNSMTYLVPEASNGDVHPGNP